MKLGSVPLSEWQKGDLDKTRLVRRNNENAWVIGCFGVIHEAATKIVSVIRVAQVYTADVRYLFQIAALAFESHANPVNADAYALASRVLILDIDCLACIASPVSPDSRLKPTLVISTVSPFTLRLPRTTPGADIGCNMPSWGYEQAATTGSITKIQITRDTITGLSATGTPAGIPPWIPGFEELSYHVDTG